jgi:hypothetical protein
VPSDGWLQDGSLLYRLTDERKPQNRDEINVTMADGSRSEASRTRRAGELLDRIRGTRRVPLSDEQIASIWDKHSMKLKGWDYGGTEAMMESRFEEAVRAIEQAQDITGEKTKPLSAAEVTEAACSIDAALRAHLRDTGEKT